MIRLKISILLMITATAIVIVLLGLVALAKEKEQAESMVCITIDFCGTSNPVTIEHPGRAIFEKQCKTCHRLDRKFVGPGLRNILDYRDSIWVYNFIRNGEQMKKSGDSLANQVDAEYNHTIHTNFEFLEDSAMYELMVYLKLENLQKL